ncbi:MAG TPA: cytochrome c biogenesis protein CcdA [Atribacteraceae bacterium]|nr:cytochrome c biogenesis protein CcdA [Atribacteraceae bacterium]
MDFELNILISFLAGLLSFLSPCILAIAPAYLGYVTGVSSLEKNRKRVVLHTVLFVVGFTGVFFVLGVGASSLGTLLFLYRPWFNRIAGIVIIVFGLQVLGLLKIRLLYSEKRLQAGRRLNRLRSLVLGMTFALGWAPCVGPILGSILLYVSTLGRFMEGGLLLSFYAAGLALPFLLLGSGWGYTMTLLRGIQRRGRLVEIISGMLLIVLGILLVTDQMQVIVHRLGFDLFINTESLLLGD